MCNLLHTRECGQCDDGMRLTWLLSNPRREGYEVAVGPPQVITKLVDGKKCEPYEEAHVEVPQEHMGQVRPLGLGPSCLGAE